MYPSVGSLTPSFARHLLPTNRSQPAIRCASSFSRRADYRPLDVRRRRSLIVVVVSEHPMSSRPSSPATSPVRPPSAHG